MLALLSNPITRPNNINKNNVNFGDLVLSRKGIDIYQKTMQTYTTKNDMEQLMWTLLAQINYKIKMQLFEKLYMAIKSS